MKTALVNGVTSGIDAAATKALVGAGWQVIATGLRADRLAALVNEHGDCVYAAALNIQDDAGTRCRSGRIT